MIICKNICASYKTASILKNIDISASAGDFLGIIGPNGAGKTTLLKVFTGVKKPTSGSVVLDEIKIAGMTRREIARKIAVVPQSAFVPPLFSVEDVVSIGRYALRENRFRESAADKNAIKDAMHKTGAIRFADRLISELSGGERQEALIARALAQEPKILMLDEPTANLDIRHQISILKLISQLVTEGPLCAIMVIHDLNLAARFCNRLVLLHNGSILAQGAPSEVLTSANLAAAYGVSAIAADNQTIGALQVTVLDCLNLHNKKEADNGMV
jgi:iron complex transport system ATP-binding protein